MTDKQIIIYGVDIRLLRTPVEVMDYLQQDGLYVVTKELFEQLKHKEQECENNKIAHQMELDIYNQECLNLQEELKETLEQLDKLKFDYAELEKRHNDSFEQFKQLKEQLEAYKMEAEEGIEINAELKAENKHLNDLLNQALKELEKTRETLIEIKEIAERGFKHSQCNCGAKADLDLILQKISEVEDE